MFDRNDVPEGRPCPPGIMRRAQAAIEAGKSVEEAVATLPPPFQLRARLELDPDYVVPEPPPRPLDNAQVLATLLVVEGQLQISDAANAVKTTPERMVSEAEGWAAFG